MNGDPPRGAPRLVNRLPAEGINSSGEHPLKEFAWVVGAGLGTLALLLALVAWGARWLAPQLPFSAEVALAERLVDGPEPPEHAARSAALQALAERVAARLDLPQGMFVVVRYDPSPIVNAHATLGGRIRVHDGLLRELRSEDALAALLAHEIAHVKHRHVAANLGRGLAVAMLLGVVSADAGAAAAQSALGQAAGLAMLGYSRAQEAQADEAALAAVVALYGHAGGMLELFERLGARPDGPALELLRSHPLTPDRLDAVRNRARDAGWATTGANTPLPAALERPACTPCPAPRMPASKETP